MAVPLVFILADTAREENIGAAARAVKTMGICELRLVNPLCDPLGDKARATAHASNDILEAAGIFPHLQAARADLSFLIGSAAKKRNVRLEAHSVEDLPGIILGKGNSIDKLGVVFGGEESGLSNSQLSECDLISTIPMLRKYPSLNLAQAVMVYAATLSKISLQHATKKRRKPSAVELPVVKEKARQVLSDVGLEPGHLIHNRIMERLMLLDEDDINLFHSFCKHYLKKYHGRIK